MTENKQVVLQAVYGQYSQSVVSRSDVQKAYSSNFGLKDSDSVFYGNTIRSVEYIGERGRVVMEYVYGTYSQSIADFKNVSKVVSSYKNLRVGDKVLYNGKIRVIECLDANGRVALEYEYGTYSQAFTTADQVSKA